MSGIEPGSSRPELSVVIAAWNGPQALRACLASLAAQISAREVEVIVAANFAVGALQSEFPFARMLDLVEEATVPKLRTAGVRAARGAIVALVEDHVRFDAAWCGEIRRAHELPHAAIGGAVDNRNARGVVDWAAYWLDYGRYMPSDTAGPTATLCGANVSYKREALQALEPLVRDGFFESVVHEALRRDGRSLYLAPGAIVYHDKRYRLGETLMRSFHLARSYAALRIEGGSTLTRIAHAMGAVALPVLLPARLAAHTLPKRRHIWELATALPVLVILEIGWALGEICGYLLGEGSSRRRWR